MIVRKLKHRALMALGQFMMRSMDSMPYMLFEGKDSSRLLCGQIGSDGVKKVLVVTDKPLVELGIVAQAMSGLAEKGVQAAVYDGVLPDPTYKLVAEGKAMYEREGCDGILAIGGGSSIDAAKVIGVSVTHKGDPQDFVGFGKVRNPIPPLYAIPTTSGTGSEATIGAVISDDETHKKSIIFGASMLPRAACLDIDLLVGLPPHITAATGMDALTHAVEAYIGTWDRGDCQKKSEAAVRMIFKHLPRAYADGNDREAREAMAQAAYMAGQAINQVNVGFVHAIAHQLGAFYGLPHGQANALVMPLVLDCSLEPARERLTELAQMIGRDTAEAFIAAVRELGKTVGIGDKAEGLVREDYPQIVARAIAEGDSYPVPKLLSPREVTGILERLTLGSAD